MVYDKLPIVFLSTIASEKSGSINSTIASYILDHLGEVRNIGIKEMAARCNVAVSSISRFCKEIGLRDFVELRELLLSTDLSFEEQSVSSRLSQRTEEYATKVIESINMVKNSVDLTKIQPICDDIRKYKRVAVFGLLKAGSVAINLQGDLLMLGKQVYTNVSYTEQIKYILTANEEDLIIIFSYTGSYFDYQDLRALKKQLVHPKIWLISSGRIDYPDYVDELILFDSLQDQGSHPYQLQFIAGLIAQEYSKTHKF